MDLLDIKLELKRLKKIAKKKFDLKKIKFTLISFTSSRTFGYFDPNTNTLAFNQLEEFPVPLGRG